VLDGKRPAFIRNLTNNPTEASELAMEKNQEVSGCVFLMVDGLTSGHPGGPMFGSSAICFLIDYPNFVLWN